MNDSLAIQMLNKLLKLVSCHIPLLMVVVFLVLVICTVVRKTTIPTTFREYAVGDKQFDTTALVVTVLATFLVGEDVVEVVKLIHFYGFSYILYTLLVALSSFWFISWLTLHMTPFMYNLSMSETIGRVYGRYPRIITAIAYLCLSAATIAVQIKIMSFSISFCITGVHSSITTFVAILILISYVTIGGIRIITFMDMVQFFAFFFMLPLLLFWIPKKTGIPPSEMLYKLCTTQERFQLSSLFHSGNTNPVFWISGFLGGIFINMTPPIIQRVYMSFDRFQASRVFFMAGVFGLIIFIFIILIALLASAAAPQLPVTEVWNNLMADMPPIIKGFTAISLLALSMSTADSYLNSASVMFSNDIVQVMMRKKVISFSDQLRWAKRAALFIGLVAITLSFCYDDVVELYLLGIRCFLPVVTAPFISAVLGFRGNSLAALIGMATGLLVIFAWVKRVTPTTGIGGAIPSMVANSLAMMAAHYLLPKSKK